MPHSPRHEATLKVIPYISAFAFLSLSVGGIISAARHLLGYGYFFKEDFTAYDAVTVAFVGAAIATVASLWSKSDTEGAKGYATFSSILWLVSFILYSRYFNGPDDLPTWKGLGLLYIVIMSAVVFYISRRLDEPRRRKDGQH
jgi:hypothetical protein